MNRLLTTLRRGFTERIGWKRVGIAASLFVIILAVTTLVRMLKGAEGGVILHRNDGNRAGQELGSPRYASIGRVLYVNVLRFLCAADHRQDVHVPYRIAALSSFTSYVIGHNIGATVFTGGAIRFRIYSDYGLNAIDVAKICFISGLTFWLGNAFVLGIGMAWHPWAASAMDSLLLEIFFPLLSPDGQSPDRGRSPACRDCQPICSGSQPERIAASSDSMAGRLCCRPPG